MYWRNEWINVTKSAEKLKASYNYDPANYDEYINFKAYTREEFKHIRITKGLTTLIWSDIKCLKFMEGEKNSLFFFSKHNLRRVECHKSNGNVSE